MTRNLTTTRPTTVAQLRAQLERVTAELAKERTRRRAANGNGGSGEVARGAYCTPKAWAERVGPWDVDPFSNPRSHIVAARRCMLEDGGNGMLDREVVGSYSAPPAFGRADENTRVFLQPPYEMVDEALEHYGHTRFCALLRFDTSTKWFAKLYRITRLVCVPRRRLAFEPPPGVKASANPYPHALYYAREEDATPRVLRACIAWRTR